MCRGCVARCLNSVGSVARCHLMGAVVVFDAGRHPICSANLDWLPTHLAFDGISHASGIELA